MSLSVIMTCRPLILALAISACDVGRESGQNLGTSGSAAPMSYRSERFFSECSPWNTPIGHEATFLPVAGVDAWPVGPSSWLGDSAANVPIYFAEEQDPERPILFNRGAWSNVASGTWRRSENPRSIEQDILRTADPELPYAVNYYSTQLAGSTGDGSSSSLPPDGTASTTEGAFHGDPLFARVPLDAVPSPDSDGHMVIIQPDGRALELYAAIVLSTGEIVSSMFSFTDPGGMGTGRERGRRASMLPSYGGILRSAELANGKIDHAMVLLAPPAMLSPTFVEPARAFDSDHSDYGGMLPMGARLAIPPATDIDELGLSTSFGTMVAKAAQTYGFFIGDRGGPGWTIVTEYHPIDPDLASWDHALNEDLNRIFETLQEVVQ